MSKVKMTLERRNWCIDQYELLKDKILNGQLQYSKSALDSDLKGFKFYSYMLIYQWQIVFGILGYVGVAFFLIPMLLVFSPVMVGVAIAAGIYKAITTKNFISYVGLCELLEEGSLNKSSNKPTTQSSPHNNSADQITKLFELKKAGALTDEEFEEQKKKLLS
jgi:hypothetical protein